MLSVWATAVVHIVYNLSPSLISRHFYFECPCFLRYTVTSKYDRARLGIPPIQYDTSLTVKELTQTGHVWEEAIIANQLAGRVFVAPGAQAVHKRVHSAEITLAYLRGERAEPLIYQPTQVPPPSFLRQFGLDPGVCTFSPCRPDLLERHEDASA